MHCVFGGSFDPVHEGHLRTAESLRQLLAVPTLSLLPAARSPLKTATTADHHRLAMLQRALQDYPGLRIDERELHRPPPSYTIDTLRELRGELGPDEPLVWIMGADTLPALDRWKNWRDIAALAHLLIVERPGACWPAAGPVAQWLAGLTPAGELNQLQCRPHGLLARAALAPHPVSSTAIRQLLITREPGTTKPQGLPECVWQYIIQHHLYQV